MSETPPPTLDYASSPGPQDWVTVKTYQHPLEAELAAAAIRREGIACQVQGGTLNATLGVYGPGIAGLQVRVPKDEEESARRLLDEIESARRARLQPKLQCPKCGAVPESKTPETRIVLWFVLIVGMILLFVSKSPYVCVGVSVVAGVLLFYPVAPRWRCPDCGNDWRAPEPVDDEDDED